MAAWYPISTQKKRCGGNPEAGRNKKSGALADAALSPGETKRIYGSVTGTVQISSLAPLRRSVQTGKILPA
jgi:hypothetical protein